MTTRARGVVAALGATVLTIVALVGPAAAQEASPVEIVGTDLTEFPTVRLAVAVTGVDDVSAEDLEVTENGEPVDAEVASLSDESIDVVLAVDVSGSMEGEPIEQARQAALDFLDELPDNARAAIIGFNESATVRSDFTEDRDASRAAVEDLVAEGGTALYDALTVAAVAVQQSDADRSAIVVLSDGADTSSQAGLEQAVGALEGVDTDFFAVSLQTAETDEAALGELAGAAGGRVVAASDPEALSAAYVDLGERIVNQYAVTFASTTPDPTGTFEVTHVPSGDAASIEVALPDRGSAAPTTTEAAAAPELLPVEADPSPLQQTWALWVGAALVGIALAITAVAVWPSGDRPRRRRSLRSDRVVEDTGTGERIVESFREAAVGVATRAVERSDRSGPIDDALDKAGLIMRAGEFVALVVLVAAGAAVVLGLVMGPVGVGLGIFVPILGAPTFLRFMARRRNAKFADQLSDTLLLMSGSLRAGFGVGQAIDSVAQEMDPPIGAEFQRAILEIRLGRNTEDALSSIARRMENEDFEWVVDAMRINHQVGGDLAQILDQVGETIRGRTRLRRQIAALTAEGRMSAIVLSALPVVIGLVLFSSNREYLDPLFDRTAGLVMLGGAVVLLVAGGLWLKKLIDVEL